MKNFFLPLLLCAAWATMAQAQVFGDEGDGQMQGRVKEMREHFINTGLGLNRDEAAQFWGLHDDFQAEQQKIKRKYRLSITDLKNLSDAEAAKMIQSRLEMEDEMHRARKVYMTKLQAVIPAKKLVLYPQAERDFKKYLLEKVKEARPRRQGGRRY